MESLGQNTVTLFIDNINKWFMQGNREKRKMMSGLERKAALELKYYTRYDLPNKHHVTNAVKALTTGKLKKKGSSGVCCRLVRKVE